MYVGTLLAALVVVDAETRANKRAPRIATFLTFFFIFACSKSETMNIKVSLSPHQSNTPLDTRKIEYTNDFFILDNLTSRLINLEPSGEYSPSLATSIKKESDTKYSIRIRESFFSNGDPITPRDVLETINRARKSGTSHTTLNKIIKEITIIDDRIDVTLHAPSRSFLYFLSLPDLGILHHTQYNKNETELKDFLEVTSGPFKYALRGDKSFLIKNKFYKLSPSSYPEEIELKSPYGNENALNIIEQKVHIGDISFKDFFKHKQKLLDTQSIRLLGSNSDSFTYLALNPSRKTFEGSYNRKWLYFKLFTHDQIQDTYSSIAKRSLQYFPYNSKAFIPESDLKSIIQSQKNYINLNKIPDEFKNGIDIYTYKSAGDVTILPLVSELLSKLPFPVRIHDTIASADANSLKKESDIFLQIISTDFRVPVEAINYEYKSEFGNLKDLSGKIDKLYHELQVSSSDNEDKQLLQEISKQMIEDCLFIPLFHSAAPSFYNENFVEAENLDNISLFSFWKIKSKI